MCDKSVFILGLFSTALCRGALLPRRGALLPRRVALVPTEVPFPHRVALLPRRVAIFYIIYYLYYFFRLGSSARK